MARNQVSKSRFEEGIWTVGEYIRLSREDGDKEESCSIGTQKSILEDYISSKSDLFLVKQYVDDGWSGTSFNRPAFQEMMRDIKAGIIKCVIVKDLSRFGRDYIEVGQYLQTTFPMMDIRFISITDNVDSYIDPESTNNLTISVKSIIDDDYCRNVSKKTRDVFNSKRNRGQFIGSFASYGYLKDPNDHNKLIIDDEASSIVRDIFQWFIDGTSIIGIAKRLNQLGIPNPSEYKRQKGFNYRHPKSSKLDGLWPDSSVRRILTNRLYVGDMVQGKTTIKSYKLKICVSVPQKDWIIVPHTHEAIIDEDTFEKTQDILSRNRRTSPNTGKMYILSGYIKCADCGKSMSRKLIAQSNKDYCYYVCSTFKKANKFACSKHTIRSDKLETAIFESIKKQIEVLVQFNEVLEKYKAGKLKNKRPIQLEKILETKLREKDKINNCRIDLYPDWKSGILSKEEYLAMKSKYDKQLETIGQNIEALKNEITSFNDVPEQNGFIARFMKYQNINSLTREVVVELIDEVLVHEGNRITIKFKFQDEYKRLVNFCNEHQLQ